ncbi:HU family DNA-binding protein [Candidatus Phytoplasma meliae]|uniref:HU family DNA-binding protein n=1 Tax=Candidatus Phytoplasma meliae TaxID=1848402 RepID=A0ABS5CXY8_9MOLU|nr:HU family DNA-binding protein [Candidatus Phytoplasma meliae]MBP5835836.1 HU family DNA-binding protein [Candidatus Phytoplasma meliae]
MTKKELINQIATELEYTKQGAEYTWNAIENIIWNQLSNHEPVILSPRIGKLIPKISAPRIARNPQSGEKIQIPEKKVIRFKVSKTLKDTLNS